MKLSIPAVCALTFFCSISNVVFAHAEGDVIDAAVKEIVKVTPRGLEPATTTLHRLDASVFFVNTTQDSLVTFDIDFTGKKAHCASSNLKFTKEEHMKSVEPIGPKDFTITCFPEKGSYPVKAFGVLPGNKPLLGTIIVE